MRKIFNFPILIGILLICSFTIKQHYSHPSKVGKIPTKLPKEITEFTGEMIFIPSGTFISELVIGDSIHFPSQQVSVQAFYMSQTEVTNNQYRFFYKDMVKLVGKDSAAFYIPDTTSFTRNLPYAFVESMKDNYYSHPAYGNYPVIGVNWLQASGFINWVNYKMEQLYKDHPEWLEKYALNNFRIPTEMEWEYAAKGNAKRTFYSWGNELMHAEKGSIIWNGNFGTIKDQGGIEIKSYLEDNAFFMAKADSYQPNVFGLYNMSGNVNEWVQDTYVDRSNVDYDLNPFRRGNDSTFKANKDKFNQYQDVYFEEGINNKVIKGGSYLDSPAHCMVGNRRAMSPDSARCDVGFRICTTFYRDPENLSWK